MSGNKPRSLPAFLIGLGAALLSGGLIAVAALVFVAIEAGLIDLWKAAGWADPSLYFCLAFAVVFAITAGVGAHLCRLGYRLLKAARG
ncbi:hypothetical protein GCM10009422_21240 [Brevundimonas kwangchunensis]|uniref:Uncharacterized protein n=1 Tax=Brevundimonas kwangchunensis TaxID=322163 RepID=A0ABN1GZY6_9CAUL